MSRTCALALMAATAPAQSQAIAEPRVLFTHHDGGCYHLTDRAECCRHKDGRNYSEAGHYYDERCVPSVVGTTFKSGRVCEPECLVKGVCGDGYSQTYLIGQCLDLDFDNSILVVSEDASPSKMETTSLWPAITEAEIEPSHGLSQRNKVIAGAVAGSVGGVALLGGLLGGLLTSTAPPEALAPSRFLEGRASGSERESILERLRSPWLAVLALAALFAIIGSIVVKSWSHEARDAPVDAQLSESTDDESLSPTQRSPPNKINSAFELIDANHDGVISQEEFNSAFGNREVGHGQTLAEDFACKVMGTRT